MTTPFELARQLLEDEEFDPKEMIFHAKDKEDAEISAKQAQGIIDRQTVVRIGGHVYNKYYINADGSPLTVRITGRVQTWRTRPEEFRVPWKYGMYMYGEITHQNADDWTTIPPAGMDRKEVRLRRARMGKTWDDRRYKTPADKPAGGAQTAGI